METSTAPSVPSTLAQAIARALRAAGGWLPFERFMELALHAPTLGYYARGDRQFGAMPGAGGSDFVTAPEMSPLFGRALAVQVAQALEATGTDEIWEFGAGTGVLAEQLLQALGPALRRYTIVDLSGALRDRQQRRLAPHRDRVRWVDRLPERFEGVVVGNEVLDAMPVTLLARRDGRWHERGVVLREQAFGWEDRITELRPPFEIEGHHDYVTECHRQAEGFMRMLVDRLERGAILLLDYGFPAHEYYHPQRSGGTLVCHRGHRMDTDPLQDPGDKDITAHVNFTGIALAAQEAADATPDRAALHLLGYTSQARFLLNCGLPAMMESASLPRRAMAQKLILEHEMGELFKAILFARGEPWEAVGFASGDRSHRL